MEDNDRDVGVSINKKANSILESIGKAEYEMQNVKRKELENALKPAIICNAMMFWCYFTTPTCVSEVAGSHWCRSWSWRNKRWMKMATTWKGKDS